MTRTCPQCSKPIPEHAPQALCPACLLSASTEAQDSTEVGPEDSAPLLHGQFAPGHVLAERYRIVSLLGKGGMGEVYRADDLLLKESVALKLLPADFAERRSVLEALRNEVKQARLVSHRHVCRVHDIGEVEGRPLLSMEFIEGEDLASLLRRIGKLPRAKVIQLATQLAQGLAAAHEQQVLHLDLKPANLMIDRRGDLKISDFGLAQLSSTAERDRRVAGTPAYMAPEQVFGEGVSARTDIFAFGLIVYEMLSGRRAFAAKRFDEVRQFHVSGEGISSLSGRGSAAALEDLVMRCLDRETAKRPASFEEIVAAMGRCEGDSLSEGAGKVGMGDLGSETSSIEESDVYLSFAPVDDQPLSAERKGWITQFHRNLEIRVEQLSGKRIRVFRPLRKDAAAPPETEVLANLPEVKALVSVVSPPFVNSEGCLREVETFWDANAQGGRLYVDGHTRVLKVVKTPVESDAVPESMRERFQELLGYEFYDFEPDSGRLREYAEWFGAEAEQRFHERIYDLAQELHALFKAMGRVPVGDTNGRGKTVYLAYTTSDVLPLRDRIRRELIGRGHRVLPERPLPLVASEAETAIQACLAECDLAIHPFGRSYGVIPEGANRSQSALQNEVSAKHSQHTGLPRILWIPNDVVAEDERQDNFLQAVKTEPELHHNAEIVVNTFQTLKPIILDKLAPKKKPEARETDSQAALRAKRIYLICDAKDEEAIDPLEDYLFEQGLDVSLPDFEADEAEAAQAHRDHLCDCDGVIIYYGAARHAWVDIKLRSILKISGYGRENPLAFAAVYIAPPFDRRKERYRTHSAEIIRQEGEFQPGLLQPLLNRLKDSHDA